MIRECESNIQTTSVPALGQKQFNQMPTIIILKFPPTKKSVLATTHNERTLMDCLANDVC